MPDHRTHRGAHPEDARDFAPDARERLAAAAYELSFLFEREYAPDAALKLVGDRHQLTARQRKAVLRASASDKSRKARDARRVGDEQLRGQSVNVDGFNCLITLEAMLARAPILRCRDHVLRDLSSVHGTYRSVAETERSVDLMFAALARRQVAAVEVLLDRPVGNSGRTRELMLRRASALPFSLGVVLSDRVDPELATSAAVVASSDSWILERAARWFDLPALVASDEGLSLWLVDLAESAQDDC